VSGYTFRTGQDVIRTADIPDGLTAVLSGHIHRAQLLSKDLEGKPLAAPILYPGSIERTSFQEKDEKKGYLTLALRKTAKGMSRRFRFHELPARPMVQIGVEAAKLSSNGLRSWLKKELREIPADAVVQLKVRGPLEDDHWSHLSAAALREVAPPTMNVTLARVNDQR
jgi:DNA repair exonuclease SbcCD nuclease subunit